MTINTQLVELAMKELKAGTISLSDYNEILLILLDRANFTISYLVKRFFEKNGVPTIANSTGWLVQPNFEKALDSRN